MTDLRTAGDIGHQVSQQRVSGDPPAGVDQTERHFL
jgi:hypothetical protein